MSRVPAANRVHRANRVRPLIHSQVQRSNLRAVAEEIGVSHGTLHNMLEKGWTPYLETLDKLEKWAATKGLGADEVQGNRGEIQADVAEEGGTREEAEPREPRPFSAEDIARRVDAIEAMDVDELVKLIKIAEISALARTLERAEEREIARIRAEAVRLAEESERNRTETLRAAEAAAQERLEILRSLLAGPIGEITEAGEVEDLATDMVLQQEQARRGKQAG